VRNFAPARFGGACRFRPKALPRSLGKSVEGPGFAVDELGEKLALPPFLEPQRAH
jgi:hypothetical protein